MPLALYLQLLGGNDSLGIRYTRLWQWRTQNFSIAGDINKKEQDPLMGTLDYVLRYL